MSTISNNNQQEKSSILRTTLVILALIFINPFGLILMFTVSRWKKWIKILILVLLIPIYVIWIINISNFVWRFKADRQVNDAYMFCDLPCQKNLQGFERYKQCRKDCVKSRLDPKVYEYIGPEIYNKYEGIK